MTRRAPAAHIEAGLPADAERRELQLELLARGEVARLVHGREPIRRDRLIEMLTVFHGLSRGAAAAAVERAASDAQIEMWVTLPVADEEDPDSARTLQAMRGESDALESARRHVERRAAADG